MQKLMNDFEAFIDNDGKIKELEQTIKEAQQAVRHKQLDAANAAIVVMECQRSIIRLLKDIRNIAA